MASLTVPETVMTESAVALLSTGEAMEITGAVWSRVITRVSVAVLPARSVAMVVIVFFPAISETSWLKEESLPTVTEVPLIVTPCRPLLSVAVPETFRSLLLVTEPSAREDTFRTGGCESRKVAVTDLAALITTVQVPVPVQAPDQPWKLQPEAAEALRVTDTPSENVFEQTCPQSMPAGALVTVPLPALVTDSVLWVTAAKDAVTVQFAVTGPVV